MKNTPIVTITCIRDLPMLDLQAQSINLYLNTDCPVYIIINEDDTDAWFIEFEKYRHYYKNHQLTILKKSDFSENWGQWIPSQTNPWAVGWETQQVLKLAISKKINTTSYLVLDSQNFLIKNWTPEQYGLINGKVPCRPGNHVMPSEIYNDYLKALDLESPLHTIGKMVICTPIFLHTGLASSLVDSQGSIDNFTSWFKTASRIKSEFTLYELWGEKHGGTYRYHYMIPQIEDWGGPYLRDCKTDEEFKEFIDFVGVHDSLAWASINHRAWGNMSDEQYLNLKIKLKDYNLNPNFDKYRSTYIDYKF